jgi:hypothetical protein
MIIGLLVYIPRLVVDDDDDDILVWMRMRMRMEKKETSIQSSSWWLFRLVLHAKKERKQQTK